MFKVISITDTREHSFGTTQALIWEDDDGQTWNVLQSDCFSGLGLEKVAETLNAIRDTAGIA